MFHAPFSNTMQVHLKVYADVLIIKSAASCPPRCAHAGAISSSWRALSDVFVIGLESSETPLRHYAKAGTMSFLHSGHHVPIGTRMVVSDRVPYVRQSYLLRCTVHTLFGMFVDRQFRRQGQARQHSLRRPKNWKPGRYAWLRRVFQGGNQAG